MNDDRQQHVPAVSPELADVFRSWARLLLSLREAGQQAEALATALEAVPHDSLHATTEWTGHELRETAIHAQWEIENLRTHFDSDAPVYVSVLTGGYNDYATSEVEY